ncbi:(2Fe-2S)-binding protein [Fulvivirga sedimenti]|uniref:(2Fe-2S)-binding protein n=1 Tax=Fulvivirga sedimenti TaxID=2879465 RepID=A0A9X1KW28_9BACT|nr:(2Fe-2S)-binding protein [Fulvivirga sedimenti]MCA6074300.1 (2Fe-2S)-binding protein [Fulvivirga sedimenti]
MPEIKLTINGSSAVYDLDSDMPLLWAIRDFAGLTGTKFSCGIGQCGACTVFMNGEPVRSCLIPVSAAADKDIVTIEGISKENDHRVQQAWIQEQVPQCGYCQSGQIMNAIALLDKNPNPSDEEIETQMRPILCRCGTYPRIKNAIKRASKS